MPSIRARSRLFRRKGRRFPGAESRPWFPRLSRRSRGSPTPCRRRCGTSTNHSARLSRCPAQPAAGRARGVRWLQSKSKVPSKRKSIAMRAWTRFAPYLNKPVLGALYHTECIVWGLSFCVIRPFRSARIPAKQNPKAAQLYVAFAVCMARTTLTTVMSSSWPKFCAVSAMVAAG